MTKPRECRGSCPNCDSEDLEYGSIQVDMDASDTVYFPFECNDCGKHGREIYLSEYLHSIIENKK